MTIPLQQTSHEIWEKKYQLRDGLGKPVDITIQDTYKRVAKALSSLEKDSDHWYKEFLWALENGATPAGRIMSNAGAKEHKPSTSLINCTVSGIVEDSMKGILQANLESGLTLAAGCGIGYEFSTLRPRGAYVSGAGATTSGSLSFMDIFDSMCFTIASAGGRRGAQMATFAIWHPDVEDFIKAKREDGRFRQFNCSLLIDDEFMKAVKEDREWKLFFPRKKEDKSSGEITFKPLFWDKEYCDKQGYITHDFPTGLEIECRVYKTIKAKELWDLIMKSTYDYAEPGFILIDRVNKFNNNYFCENIRTTNPCLHPDSIIETVQGRVKIKDITGPIKVYTMDSEGKLSIGCATASWISKKNAQTINITTRNGKTIRVTPDHKVMVQDKGWVQACAIELGDRIVQLCRARRGAAYSGVKLTTEHNRAYRMEHVMIADAVYGVEEGEDVHHLNGNTYDNWIDNLEVMTHSEHSRHTALKDNPQSHQVTGGGRFLYNGGTKRKTVVLMPEELRSNMKNNYCNSVVSIEEGEVTDVYDMTVEGTHNFIADFMVVHNCGEQPLPPYGACLLGSINLTKFVDNPFTDKASFDWSKYRKVIRIFTRMLDNVVDINGLPLEQQREEILSKRRHGMGYLGLGSMFSLLGMTYGSKESVAFTEQISYETALEGFWEGVELAKEKGAAPLLQDSSNLESWIGGKYMQELISHCPSLGAELRENGCRFTHHSSIAPTGTISLSLNNNASNGIEPTFCHSYIRNVIKEGKNTKEAVTVYSYEMLLYKHLFNTDEIPDKFSTTDSVTWKNHIDIQAASQKWVDSSISKTVNVPTDMDFEEFKGVYMYAYEQGLKGVTTFRFNPEAFQGVLVKEEDLKSTNYIFETEGGEVHEVSGDTIIEYEGQEQTAANLYDALKEGYFGKF